MQSPVHFAKQVRTAVLKISSMIGSLALVCKDIQVKPEGTEHRMDSFVETCRCCQAPEQSLQGLSSSL